MAKIIINIGIKLHSHAKYLNATGKRTEVKYITYKSMKKREKIKT